MKLQQVLPLGIRVMKMEGKDGSRVQEVGFQECRAWTVSLLALHHDYRQPILAKIEARNLS